MSIVVLQVKGANEVALEAAIIKQTREHQETSDVVETTITVPGQVFFQPSHSSSRDYSVAHA